ncbi:unnamed protein product [Aphanomyces euteiches]|uniref:FYVE-type domain-containing protein n=1 Tax=Aphanomyces euteiches TaxID=100861 RepID=A0A6G0WXT6_9STRA|nr:hypothetical protein Ae201684_010587 [Aphanomyces euteiches]KAH9089884.1 hypothetical protein Ae201684P_014639 [Aphanomyces euteiches]KAH9150775.1 hypothetical protein AeRB84_006444 [Aphanomyces euteiches]
MRATREVEEVMEDVMASMPRSSFTKLNDSLVRLSINGDSIRKSLSLAAKWRSAGYNPFHHDSDGLTALHRAASKGDDSLAKALLSSYEGDVVKFACLGTTKQGHTALHLACKGGHLDVAMTLLDVAGKPILNCVDRHGNTALHFAATSCAPESFTLLQWLVAHAPRSLLSQPNNHGLSPVAAHIAIATADSAAMLRLFLERQVDPNAIVRGENTLLHVCVERHLYNMAGCLVEFGAALNLPDSRGVLVTDIVPDHHLGSLVKYSSRPQDWVNHVRKACMSCSRKFGFLNRRHHCRLCGRILCGKCTKNKRTLGLAEGVQTAVRVCHVCVSVLGEHRKSGSMTDVTMEVESPVMLR